MVGMESPDNRRKADDSYRVHPRRKETTPKPSAKGEGAMFVSIPWDIWVAVVLCIATVLAAIFKPPPIIYSWGVCHYFQF